MKLTKAQRLAFVRAAMADVPRTDYHEEIRQIAQAKVDSYMPAALVQAIQADASIGEWISREYSYLPGFPCGAYLCGSGEAIKRLANDAEFSQVSAELYSKEKAQCEMLGALEDKLKATAMGCSTRAALLQALPEFAKYLPPEVQAVSANTPALLGLLSDFMAAGWPKQGAQTAQDTPEEQKDPTEQLQPA